MKHYVDVVWAFCRLTDQIDITKLGWLIDAKLDTGRELFPIPYASFPDRTALRQALEHPDDHVPPQGDAADDKAGQLLFDAAALNKQQAILVVRRRLIHVLLAED